MHRDMQWWTRLRVRQAQEPVSKRALCREEGISYKTLEKVLSHSEPPGYRRAAPVVEPKLGPFVARIEEILVSDKALPQKQRHTAQRIFERLVEEGYSGGYTQVREKVAQLRRQSGEVFIPLRHDPGTAQMDVGQALVRQDGPLRKVYFLVMVLPDSDALFVQAFWHARTEMFGEFHNRAFEYFGGVLRDRGAVSGGSVMTMTRCWCRRLRVSGRDASRMASYSCRVTTALRSTSAG